MKMQDNEIDDEYFYNKLSEDIKTSAQKQLKTVMKNLLIKKAYKYHNFNEFL